jgi:hypothetical protein
LSVTTRLSLFQDRQRRFADAEQAQQRRFNHLALARVALFVTGALTVYFLGKFHGTGAVLLALVGFTATYLALLTRHQRVRRQRDEARFLKTLNADEAERLEGRFVRPETGLDFDEPHHPYTADLDVFGTRSLFRLLNRTRTHAGAQTLAAWLKVPASRQQILSRQEAVRELSEKLDWRQGTEATAGLQEAAGESTAALLSWMSEPPNPVVDQAWYRAARVGLPALTALLVVLWLNETVPFAAVALSLLVSGLALGKIFAAVKRATEQTHRAIPALRAAAAVLERLETEPFFSEKLHALKTRTTGAPAAVRRLSHTLDALSYRQNPYFALFIGLPTLWDFQFYVPLERWKTRHRAHLPCPTGSPPSANSKRSTASPVWPSPNRGSSSQNFKPRTSNRAADRFKLYNLATRSSPPLSA